MRSRPEPRRAVPCILFVLTACCLSALSARADALVVVRAMTASTIAEVFIERGTITVELEIGMVDLPAFRNLLPDPIYEKLGLGSASLATRLPRFFAEDLVIRVDDGPPLLGRVEAMQGRPRVERDKITGEPLPITAGEEEVVFFVTLVYSLDGRPRSLMLRPPRGESGSAVANIGFVVYHRGLPVIDFRYLGADERLHLDWDDPWYSSFENRNLRRQFDAPISAFLYVEPWEVRKEIVLRPKDLEEWIDLGLQGRKTIPVAEQGELKRKVAGFLAERSRVTIDGKAAEGELDRIHFIYRNLRTSGVIDPPRELDTISAMLGVIFVYPVDGLPDEVTLKWELFGARSGRIPVVATDEAGGLPSFLTTDDNVLIWQNFLRNPTIPRMIEIESPGSARRLPWLVGAGFCLAGLIGVGLRRGERKGWTPVLAVALVVVAGASLFLAFRSTVVSDEQAETVLAGLLRNVYRAFDYREESRIYDMLEKSVAGDLLTGIYLETRRSLELENQGGARARVQKVEVVESNTDELRDARGFVSDCTWNVDGSVGHWGHLHQRKNQYRARVVVTAVDGAWKITDLELLQEERL